MTPRSRPSNKRVSGARVLTSADCLAVLKEKEDKKRKAAEEKDTERKREREEKKKTVRKI